MFITISAVLFEDAVILGAASDGVTYKPPSEDTKKSVQNLPFCIVERTVSCLTVIIEFLNTQVLKGKVFGFVFISVFPHF